MGLSEKEKMALAKVKKLASIEILALDKKRIGVRVTIDPNADVMKIAGAVGDWLEDVAEMLRLNGNKAKGKDLALYMQSKSNSKNPS